MTESPGGASRWLAPSTLLALAILVVLPICADPGDGAAGVTDAAAIRGAPSVPGQAAVIVGSDRAVDDERAETPHVEPYLAAHPDDPEHLVGVATVVEEDGWRNATFASFDGGDSWMRAELPGCEGDPWVAFGSGSRVYASCLIDRPRPDGDNAIATGLHRSDDGGRTWSGPVAVPFGPGGSTDHPTLIVDRGTTPMIYLTQGQWLEVPERRGRFCVPSLSRSVDGGATLEEPVFLPHDNLHQQPLDAGLLLDGTVAVLFQDHMVANRPLAHRRTWMTISTDGGRSLAPPTLVQEQTGSEIPWGMAVDPSAAARRDRIYVVIDGRWSRSDTAPPAGSGDGSSAILVMHSDDRGETWSAPVAVSDATPGIERGIPAIAVNGNGIVGVAWYDGRLDPGAGCFDIFLTASVDGGDSWLAETRLTGETSCPAEGPGPGVARRFPLGGDYSGLAAAAAGSFHVLWADARTGTYQVRHTRIEVERVETRPRSR